MKIRKIYNTNKFSAVAEIVYYSMSLSDDGWLFHTNRPATEKARLKRFARVRTELLPLSL